jgi:hypothetical protein
VIVDFQAFGSGIGKPSTTVCHLGFPYHGEPLQRSGDR